MVNEQHFMISMYLTKETGSFYREGEFIDNEVYNQIRILEGTTVTKNLTKDEQGLQNVDTLKTVQQIYNLVQIL
jgi:hypothetical protein